MALFMLDCDSVTSTGSTLDSIAKEITNIGSTVSGYDTSCEDGFDFASAKSAISSNIEACSTKIQNASKIVSAVVSSHTNLQNQLIYGKEEEKEESKSGSSSSSSSSGGGGGSYSGGGGGGYYSGGSSAGTSVVGGTTQTTKTEDDKLEELRKILEGEDSVEVKTEVKKITCNAVDKEKLTDEEKEIFENEKYTYNTDGYAMIGNRYVISCDKSFGKVGDAITFTREDGTSVDCIIGQVTEDEASKNTVNFFVDPDKWKASNKNNINIDLEKDIKKITNNGKAKIEDTTKTTTKDADTKTDTASSTENSSTTDTTTESSTSTDTNTTTTTDTSTDTNTNTEGTTKDKTSENPFIAMIEREKEKNSDSKSIVNSIFDKKDEDTKV